MEQQMRLTRTHDTNQRCICEFYSPSYSLFVLAAFLLPVFFTAAKKKNQIRINIHPLYKLRSRKSPIRYIIFVVNLQSSSELSGDGAAWPFGLGPRDRPFRSVSVGFLSTTIVPVCAMFADVYPFGVLDDAPFVADWLAIVPQSGRQFQTSLSAMPHNFLIFFSWLDLVYKTQMSKSASDRRKKTKQNKVTTTKTRNNKERNYWCDTHKQMHTGRRGNCPLYSRSHRTKNAYRTPTAANEYPAYRFRPSPSRRLLLRVSRHNFSFGRPYSQHLVRSHVIPIWPPVQHDECQVDGVNTNNK